ncbi:MAG: hypothetical protein AB7F35_21655 [Acetobacteraceae bacterium]
MIAQRLLAVLSAVFLVCAVALATIGSRAISLGRGLASLDAHLEENLHGWTMHVFGPWAWNELVTPLLMRPVWLVPASLGLICMGLSLSLSYRKAGRQSHRRS